jgi:Family of unknown function (DUF5335)
MSKRGPNFGIISKKICFHGEVTDMQNLHLERREWQNMLDHISRAEDSHRVTIEVDREDIGAQKEVENAVLHGFSYDPKGSTIAIRAGAVEHMIVRPERIEAAHAGTDLICVEILGGDKTRHLITFVPPLHLPGLLLPAQR